MGTTERETKRPRWKRLLKAAGVVTALFIVAALAGAPKLIDALGGASARLAVSDAGALSPAARVLLDEVYSGIDTSKLVDYHTHVAGLGNGTDCWVNPKMLSWRHPAHYVRFLVYLSAAGVGDASAADHVFIDRLLELARAQPHATKHFVLAFDHRYRTDGTRDEAGSEFYVPNEYVAELAGEHSEVFRACISVHPYRADATALLERWGARGVKLVKWLPNAMGIDPASERCDAFYAKLVELDMTLLTHTGMEKAVASVADQELGNPLRLRRALDAGVRVIAAHCASTGEGDDLDNPGERRTNLELFLRLMDEPRYEGLLFGDLSTITQVNRFGNALEELLDREDLHGRLVNGSDWPLPAINVLYQLGKLERAGFLSAADRPLLAELYDYNPLLFDLALKRRVRSPGTGRAFAPGVFEGKAALGY